MKENDPLIFSLHIASLINLIHSHGAYSLRIHDLKTFLPNPIHDFTLHSHFQFFKYPIIIFIYIYI